LSGDTIKKDYKVGGTKRDVHPNTLGIVRGEFTVEKNLDKKLRVGLFSKEQSFPAWVRFSNGGVSSCSSHLEPETNSFTGSPGQIMKLTPRAALSNFSRKMTMVSRKEWDKIFFLLHPKLHRSERLSSFMMESTTLTTNLDQF
jgi:hypothetical protein